MRTSYVYDYVYVLIIYYVAISICLPRIMK